MMAGSDYTRGKMNVDSQKAMYDGAMKASLWGALIVILALAYATFTLSIGMNWIIALALCAGLGLAIGFGMGMGGAWIATVIALSALAVILQIIITLVGLLL